MKLSGAKIANDHRNQGAYKTPGNQGAYKTPGIEQRMVGNKKTLMIKKTKDNLQLHISAFNCNVCFYLEVSKGDRKLDELCIVIVITPNLQPNSLTV